MSAFGRVLVIDDDRDIAQMLRAKLTQLGFEVETHHSAKRSLDAAKKCVPDLILLDVMLGDGIGYQVARAIRKDPLLYKTPILFQSCLDEQREVAHAYLEGGDGYLTKPYTLDGLTDSLEKMERINKETDLRCPITGLYSLTRLRREINHRLFRGDSFALFYMAMEGLTSLHKRAVHDEIGIISKSIGGAILQLLDDCGFYEAIPCHMGGGYFMVMTKLADRTRFRKSLDEAFTNTTQGNGTNQLKPQQIGHRTYIPGSLLVAYTHTDRKEYSAASQMIEELKRADVQWKVRKIKQSDNVGSTSWLE